MTNLQIGDKIEMLTNSIFYKIGDIGEIKSFKIHYNSSFRFEINGHLLRGNKRDEGMRFKRVTKNNSKAYSYTYKFISQPPTGQNQTCEHGCSKSDFCYYCDGHRENKKPLCECGAHKVNSNVHSSWCSLSNSGISA